MTAVLGLSAAALWATFDLFAVRLARTIGPFETTFWVLMAGAVVLLPLKIAVDWGEPLFADASAVGFAALAGVLDAVGFMAFSRGLATGNLSIVAPIAGLSGALAAIIAIALGESLETAVAAGVAIAVIGGILTATDRGLRSAKGAGWALAGAACFGGLFFMYGETDGITELETVLVTRLVGVAVLLPMMLARRPRLSRRTVKLAGFGGLLDTVGFVLFAVAAQRGPTSVASVTGAQVATIGALLGILVLRERPAWWQGIGIGVTAVGVTLLALGG
ncbi:MAG: EamA family transporter [Gaiellales bacterium]